MIKKDLRKIYRAQRLALTDRERAKLDDLMLIQFQHSGIEIPETIMTYAPLEKFAEFNPAYIEDYCVFKNPAVQFVYPVMKGHELNPVQTDADTSFVKNNMDIDEPVDGVPIDPEKIDMIFVPLIIADISGNRVGYGKGFYDRFLKQCRKNIVTIGFCYFEPVQEISDVFHEDVPLNYCVTPQACYPF